ncbi:hypothetical protein [Brevibacillus dissolubilis]|uniref:hypothetical protein n=1 Tax=Brevibacillus dissolubilis TaxID=1844116 RepID=UPI001115FA3C|nr:hypothetical protein [Brevibacillus dissolubilis]
MNWQNVQKRINEIIQVDVMADDESDFMATHMPFSRLPVQFSGRKDSLAVQMSEEEVYSQLVFNPNNEHRMIIVNGPNGSGKSHLIRWIRARMYSDNNIDTINNEKVVFIRRIDNTLRGTIRQLLEQGVVTDPIQLERLRQFVQSSDIQNEEELKSTLFYAFLTRVETDKEDIDYRSAERRRLASFLRDDDVKKILMEDDGPISRFYELLAKPHGVKQQVEAAFRAEDFMGMRKIMNTIQRNGSQDAKLIIARVLKENEAEKLATYLNRFSHAVIQQCANMAQGDVGEMIRQLRLDLKREGKALTVLIEDMTTFTGLDAELIKVLSVPHEGEYQDLCRVTSVIGLTNAYYDTYFRDNFQNRVTHQINVDGNIFGDADTLGEMAARYINATYMTKQEAKEWNERGAEQELLPYRTWEPDFEWESERIADREFSLFPFNRRSLLNLFNRLPEKTPRFFLRDVIKVQLNAWVQYQLGQGMFPDTKVSAIGENPLQFTEFQHNARFESVDLPQEKKQVLRAILCLWGDGHLHEEGEEPNHTIGNLSVPFLRFFGMNGLSGVRQTSIQNVSAAELIDVTPAISTQAATSKTMSVAEKNYRSELEALANWYEKKERLAFHEDFRKRVRLFLADAINWQLEGIPAYLASRKLALQNIYIEDQLERQEAKENLIFIKRDRDSYWMLIALTEWNYYGSSWDFKDAPFMQYRLIAWLEANKADIISRFKGEPGVTPMHTLQWSMSLEYLRLGLTGGLAQTESDDILLRKIFSQSENVSSRSDTDDAWSRLLKYIQHDARKSQFEENQKTLTRLPNTQMGSVIEDRNSKVLIHRDQVEQAFCTLKNLYWDVSTLLPDQSIERGELSTSAARLLQSLLPRVKEVLQDEKRKATELLKKLKAKLGESLERDTWVEASREMVNFLYMLNTEYHINFQSNLRTRSEKLEEIAEELANTCKRSYEVIEGMKFSQELAFFSTDPCQLLQDALDIILTIEDLAFKEAQKADSALASLRHDTSTGSENVKLVEVGLVSLIDRINALGGVNHVN